MDNRIDRKNDENLYQPQIHSERIRALYQIKQSTGKPMTVLLDLAIRDFAQNYNVEYPFEEEVQEPVEAQTWEDVVEMRELLDRLDYLRCLVRLEQIKNHDQGGNTNQ